MIAIIYYLVNLEFFLLFPHHISLSMPSFTVDKSPVLERKASFKGITPCAFQFPSTDAVGCYTCPQSTPVGRVAPRGLGFFVTEATTFPGWTHA